MGTLLFPVPDFVSVETVRKLAKLHAAALSGDIIGIAFMVEHPGNHFTVDIAGEVNRDLDRTRGRVLDLNDALKELKQKDR